jgi:flagellar biosynthesis protein FlhA
MAEPALSWKASSFDRLGGFVKRHSDWILGVGVLGLMVTLITPMPAWLLDILLAFNITTSVLLLMITMNARDSVELSTFPTILLFTTLFRLGLNVASTRLILMNGEAGRIIRTFGEYVGGSNLAVGLVVFLILIVIQFVVITKGSGRVSEVAARFVLDAMPGKQMAIDADMNAGLIDAEEAKRRRAAIASEAEFYGAMDGASKFVRGDAIAGLIITALNLVGGIAIALTKGQTLALAADRYSKLTIGDCLVSQIPALFVSTAAGVLVTKGKSASSLGSNLVVQLSSRPKATLIAAGMMFVVGLLPGMPKLPFFVLATVLTSWWRSSRDEETRTEAARSDAERKAKRTAEESATKSSSEKVEELIQVDRVCLEIGYRLIPLVQDKSGGGILDHIAQLRRRFALKEGVVLPPVRIKDNIKLAPNAYRILLGGLEIASGSIEPGEYLAMDGGGTSGRVKGRSTSDPAFGLPAWWIREEHRDEAERLGYTVIDPTSVRVTHLSETLRKAMAELLTRDDVKELVESARKVSPAVVEELVPARMGFGEIQKVLRNLLREGVSIRNVPAILEALADHVEKTRDSDAPTELARQRLGRAICEKHSDKEGTLRAVTLDPRVEARLVAAVTGTREVDAASVGPAYLQKLMERVGEAIASASKGGRDVVLLVRSNVRRFLNELASAWLPKVAVLSFNEVARHGRSRPSQS